jgi:hypothetical protein
MLRTLIAITDESTIFQADTVEYQGKLWLVPEWLEAPTEGWKKPRRIIRLDGLEYQRLEAGDPRGNFVLKWPIPRAVIEGRDQNAANNGYVVVELPLGIQVPIPRGFH